MDKYNAIIITEKGNTLRYNPTLKRGCEETEYFCSDSEIKIEKGGISLIFSINTLTIEAINNVMVLMGIARNEVQARIEGREHKGECV